MMGFHASERKVATTHSTWFERDGQQWRALQPYVTLLHNREIPRFLALLFFVAQAGHAADQPVFYVDKGACPFECCTYRDWSTEKTTKLYAKPKLSSQILGRAKKGDTVKAQTGEVHTKPGKLNVRRDTAAYRKGDILWVYTYLGERYFKIWYQGKFIEDQIDFDYHNPGAQDWGYFEVVPKSVWWIKVRIPSGLEGWTNHPEHFSGMDACG